MSKKKHKRASIAPDYQMFSCSPLFYPYPNSSMGIYGYGVREQGSCASWGIRWIYALLLLIVIVLQFGKNNIYKSSSQNCCSCGFGGCTPCMDGHNSMPQNNQLIDNSVLFIIVVFLLVLCGGCWWGGYGSQSMGYDNYGAYGGPAG